MDRTIAFYQNCVKKRLSEYEDHHPEWAETELSFDDKRMRYIVMSVGWLGEKRVHHCLVHIDICDGRIVIQANNTEDLLDEELVDLGIPLNKIEFGFIPPSVRAFIATQEQQAQLEPA